MELEYSQITEMAFTMGGEGFEDFAEAGIVELMVDKERGEDELVAMAIETNDRDSDPDEEDSEPVTFSAREILINASLNMRRSINI